MRTIRQNLGYCLFVGGLALCSTFFTIRVEMMRAAVAPPALSTTLSPSAGSGTGVASEPAAVQPTPPTQPEGGN